MNIVPNISASWLKAFVIVQEQGHQQFFFAQPADYLESELTEL